MVIERVITISESRNVSVKQYENDMYKLVYRNSYLYCDRFGFINILIQIDERVIENTSCSVAGFTLYNGIYDLTVEPEHVDEFIRTLTEASYKTIPLLKSYPELFRNEPISYSWIKE